MRKAHAAVGLLAVVASLAQAQPAVYNSHFAASLDTWYTYVSNNWGHPRMGTASWSSVHDSSAMLTVDTPGLCVVGLMQPIHQPLYAGDSAWVDVYTPDMAAHNASFWLLLGGGNLFGGQETALAGPAEGSHHVKLVANRDYSAGSALMYQLASWPGTCTVYVGTLSAAIEERPPSVAVPSRGRIELRPNPSNRLVKVTYDLPRTERAVVRILDASGRAVRVLLDEVAPAGRHEARWDCRNCNGMPVAAGTYYFVVETARGVMSKKAIVAD